MQRTIQKLSWNDISTQVAKVNPALANEIDQLNPSPDHTIYKIQYQFGDQILNKSIFQLPNQKGILTSILDNDIHPEVRAALNYNKNSNPVCMLLNKTAELYVTVGHQVIPYILLKPGQMMGLWGDIFNFSKTHNHPEFIWDMSAGARCIFMLPKISDAVNHKKLQFETGIKTDVPQHLYQHWNIFKDLVEMNEGESHQWQMNMLCFSKKWFEQKGDPYWEKFYYFLLRSAWANSEYHRNHAFWNLIFSMLRQKNNIQVDNYFCDIVKHLFNIGMGVSSGFAPALDEECAPIKYLQSVYVDGAYNLKHYIPTIMAPTAFSFDNSKQQPVYFSPKYLTTMDLSPKLNKRPSVITELQTIQTTLAQYIEGILTNEFNVVSTVLYDMLKKVGFDFFHFYKTPEYVDDIQPTQLLIQNDLRFSEALIPIKNRVVPASASFIRNCIRIKQ